MRIPWTPASHCPPGRMPPMCWCPAGSPPSPWRCCTSQPGLLLPPLGWRDQRGGPQTSWHHWGVYQDCAGCVCIGSLLSRRLRVVKLCTVSHWTVPPSCCCWSSRLVINKNLLLTATPREAGTGQEMMWINKHLYWQVLVLGPTFHQFTSFKPTLASVEVLFSNIKGKIYQFSIWEDNFINWIRISSFLTPLRD